LKLRDQGRIRWGYTGKAVYTLPGNVWNPSKYAIFKGIKE
jgi:hypothetical protein